MGKKFGICCIVLGICCLIASAGLIVYNQREAEFARNASTDILQDVREIITDLPEETIPAEEAADVPREMLTTQVKGYDCLGVLAVPVLELELPVLKDWDYDKLRIAPCQYYGSYFEKDFVIAAHNYPSQFGKLTALQPGDLVLFTDISGTVHYYEVVLLETLPEEATEEMITSGFDMSLYTCTTGGASRVTVRCRSVQR